MRVQIPGPLAATSWIKANFPPDLIEYLRNLALAINDMETLYRSDLEGQMPDVARLIDELRDEIAGLRQGVQQVSSTVAGTEDAAQRFGRELDEVRAIAASLDAGAKAAAGDVADLSALVRQSDIEDLRGVVGDLAAQLRPSGDSLARAQNLLADSEDFTTGNWTASGITPVANNCYAPDGTLTADEAEDNDAAAFESLTSAAVTVAASAAYYTASMHVRKSETVTFFPGVRLLFSGVSNRQRTVDINRHTGLTATSGNATLLDSGAVSTGDFWRVWVAARDPLGTNTAVSMVYYPAFSTTLGTGSSAAVGVTHIWGAQISRTAELTPYVKKGALKMATRSEVGAGSALITGTAAAPETLLTALTNATFKLRKVTFTSQNTASAVAFSVYIVPSAGTVSAGARVLYDYTLAPKVEDTPFALTGRVLNSGETLKVAMLSASHTSDVSYRLDYEEIIG